MTATSTEGIGPLTEWDTPALSNALDALRLSLRFKLPDVP
jgi:hypothetical protein